MSELGATVGEWVRYHPPKSAMFGHQARSRDARRAWEATQRFLTEFTQFEVGMNLLRLTCYEPSQQTDPSLAEIRTREARSLFGPEQQDAGHSSWDLDPSQLPRAIAFALDDDKHPVQERGPSRLSFHYWFRWKSLGKSSAHDDSRPDDSNLGITLGGQRVFLQPTFAFPVAWCSAEFREFLTTIEPLTPFRFRDQYFQRWLRPTNSTSFGQYRRLDKDWRRSWEVN